MLRDSDSELRKTKKKVFSLLFCRLAADFLSNDVVLHGEEAVEEDEQADHGGRQQPTRVEPWKNH